MGAGYEKQEGQHDQLYKAGVGLERVNKSPRTLSLEGALLLCCIYFEYEWLDPKD